MPVRRELRPLYPPDWPEISRQVRFVRAGGRCERCGRPHLSAVWQLPDGRWLDDSTGLWRDDGGRPAPWPDLVELAEAADRRRVILATAHLDHDPRHNHPANLAALCGRCHLAHDRPVHRLRRLATLRARRAWGDLFAGLRPLLPAG